MKRALVLALLTCLAAPAWATMAANDGASAASRCAILRPSCPTSKYMSRAGLAVFRYLTVDDISKLPRDERTLALDHIDRTVHPARSRSKTACEDADRVIKLMQRGASRAVRRHADELVAFVMEPNCQ
ncbi:MAG: hypothetical protein ACFNX6_07330 [Lautropia mirabilis]